MEEEHKKYWRTSIRTPKHSSGRHEENLGTPSMLELASNFIQELYSLGARVIGVFNFPPLGCLLSQRTWHGGIERVCYDAENQAAILFNSKLSPLIDSLNKRLPEARVIYLDIFNPLLSMIQNPAQYGFEVVDRGSCGTGDIEAGPLCKLLLKVETKRKCSITELPRYLQRCVQVHILAWNGYHSTEPGGI